MASSVVAAKHWYRSFPPFSYMPTHTAKLHRKPMLLLGKEDDDPILLWKWVSASIQGEVVWGTYVACTETFQCGPYQNSCFSIGHLTLSCTKKMQF